MKKRHLLKTLLLLFALIVGVGSSWGQVTITKTMSEIVSANGYTVSAGNTATCYNSFSLDENIVISTTGEANCGSFWGTSPNHDWRLYQNKGGNITITANNDCTLSSVTITYNVSNGGVLKDGSSTVATGTAQSLTGNTKTYTVGNTGTATNGQVRITKISVTYTKPGQSILQNCDLALNGAPVALSFDLYNNSTAQTISYTTSSTGAVTVSANDYVTTVVDKTSKTITVTPTAVTSGAQTITVNQAADDTYAAGSVTFTVNIKDSTPFNGVIFDATEDKGTSPIVKDNVSLACTSGVLDNESEYRFYKNSVTTISTTDGSIITKIEFIGTSNNPASGFASQDGWTTNGNNGTWTGKAESVSFTASGAQVRATVIKVTVEANTNPAITAENVDIAYDATGGNIAFTVNNKVEGGSISASTTQDTWVTLGTETSSPISFTCSANETNTARTATVTLTYTYNTSETVTKEVTITQAGNPNVVDNISDITEVGSSYKVRGTVVATNSRGFVIGDGTGYVYTYLNDAPTKSVGDMVTISGTTGSYGHIIQFTNTATVSEATSSNYTAGMPAAIVLTAVPDYTQGYHLSTYLKFEGTLSKDGNNYLITLGESQIQISYPSTAQGTALTALDGKTVRVKGYFSGINSNSKFTIMLESVEEVVSTEPSISLSNYNVEAPVEGKEGTITVTYNNITEVEAEVRFYEADGTTEKTYDWIIAEINDENNIEYLVDANDGAERKAYLKVYALDDDANEVYSDLITITQAKYVIDYATLPFEFNGGKTDIESTDGLTANGLGSDYNSSPKLKFDSTGDCMILHFNEAPGALTFDIKGNSFSGGTFTVQSSADGTNYTALVSYTELSGTEETKLISGIGSDVRYIKWIYTEKVDGNVGLGNIKLEKIPEKETVTVSNAKYATYSSAYSLDFSESGITVYTAKANGTSVKLTEVSDGIVPANTGVVLYSAEAVTKEVPVTTETGDADWSNNKMVANVVRAKVYLTEGDKTNYILSNEDAGVGFYKAAANGAYLPANRAYLSTTATATGNAPFLGFDGNETTGINSVERGALSVEGCYTLDGRRVAQPTKGLYIVNGRKVIIK